MNRKNPEVGLFFSAPRLLLLMVLFYTGLLPFISLRETHLEIPMLSLFLSPKYASSKKIIFKTLSAVSLNSSHPSVKDDSVNFYLINNVVNSNNFFIFSCNRNAQVIVEKRKSVFKIINIDI